MNNFIFDIVHYVHLNGYTEKRKYIDTHVFYKARQISNEYFVRECEFIIIQIREYCLLFPVVDGVLLETSEKRISINDAQIYNYVLRQKKYTKELIELQPVTSTNDSTGTQAPQQISNSLQSVLSNEQLTELHKELNEKYIAKIDFNEFIPIFNDKLTDKTKPLKWIKSNRLLAYFFNCLFSYNFINNEFWQSVIEKNNLFLNRNNKPIKANDLSVAISNYNGVSNPKGSENIDSIINKLKSKKP
jgi:hypothetical protein